RGPARQQAQAQRRPEEGTPIGFVFQELLHEPGTKTVLGERYREAGIEEGERVIRTVCQHPSTARFVATKLVTHFVSDEPPAAAVDRGATGGRRAAHPQVLPTPVARALRRTEPGAALRQRRAAGRCRGSRREDVLL